MYSSKHLHYHTEHAQQALILLQEELLSPPGSAEPAAPPQVILTDMYRYIHFYVCT
jgi:hypothetical protein